MNYSNIKSKCAPDNIFDTITIQITIAPSKQENGEDLDYRIQDLGINEEKSSNLDSELYQVLKRHCALLKERIANDLPMKWKVFYLYKELFQKIICESSIGSFNYFRGQAKNWKTIPGIFRTNTSATFIDEFEKIYKRISIEFPNEIEYTEYETNPDSLKKRAKQLAMLQHYGLRTSLLDLTRNPYIALLFMVSDSSKTDFSSGVIEAYQIDEDKHNQNNIFISVEKEENNRRLKAQDGAFLYYDKLANLDIESIIKIPRIVIELSYDTSELAKDIEEKISEIETALSQLPANFPKNISEAFDEELAKLKKDLCEVKTNVDKTGIFTKIHDEIKSKLNEYFYFEESLFPDLYKYIEFIQPKYINRPNVQVKL
ncbi:FRG domain-containing protein [Enterococcus ratti]|uniref:FRG domain-containing protein n=1 Tax=Enterococcus ratti TaxID=150033 RepID=A0A1L8WI72_9ENTE|nr:FRG domain-containing protein [Enterococcus ratti]OJG80733.1 hypothetical protein RV14_GL000475 [Enterococcus ratti]